MSETRPDFPGITADEPSEVDNDRTGSDGTLHTEPLANGEPSAVNAERTASDALPDAEPRVSEVEGDAEPTVSGAAGDAEPDAERFPVDTDPRGFDAVRVGSLSMRDTEPATSDAELDTATAASGAADRELDAKGPASGRAHLALGNPVVARPDFAAGPSAPGEPGADSDARWREIQATFVDDPRGSVEQALRAVDDEVTAVLDALRRRQEALAPSRAPGQTNGGQAYQLSGLAAGSNPGDTEQLRIALRDCRAFWRDLDELSDRLG
jgi:hypothetical protein